MSVYFQSSRHGHGREVLQDPKRNKGTAFTEEEREELGLRGLLPPRVSSLDAQRERVHQRLQAQPDPISKYVFLTDLQERNETLFYRLLADKLVDLMPVVYTPTVGEACRRFGYIFRRPRGLYISIADRGRIHELLANWPERDVRVIVVTDGERILGLGDLGVYGMGIPIGKLTLYTACGGVPPEKCLPITLDVGTDNQTLRHDRLYTGLDQGRVRGPEYDAFVEEFVTAVQERWPEVLLQWEDFATENAFTLLGRYRDRLCTFNDDIQGTAAVVVAALLGACRVKGESLKDQRILFFGAGAAGTGVASLIAAAMERQGVPLDEARRQCWLFDRKGLVVAGRNDLQAHKRPFAHPHEPVTDLLAAVRALRPTALIGLSAQPAVFTAAVLQEMGALNQKPIVFALSNPTDKAECTAAQAYAATGGRALFASGSPFDPVPYEGRLLVPAQANNAYVFPGMGLGCVLARVSHVSDAMLLAAAEACAECLQEADAQKGRLLPQLASIRDVSAHIAATVVRVAMAEGLARAHVPPDVETWVRQGMYEPSYERNGIAALR
jgi:malate dehydrogenase (oxaloacetate-decarboxylating)(NADP+)